MGVALTTLVLFVGSWLALTIVRLVLEHRRLRRQLSTLPQPRSLFGLGHALITKPDPDGFVAQVMGMGTLYSGATVLWIGFKPVVMVWKAQYLEPILSSQFHLNKGYVYNFLYPWLGLGLLTSDAVRWRPKRKLLTPTFHYDILRDFVPVFNKQAAILVRKLEKLEGEDVDIGAHITLCALDIICETSMGRSCNAQLQASSPYVRAIYEINDVVQRRMRSPWLWPDWIFALSSDGRAHANCLRILHGFTRQVIAERRAQLEACNFRPAEDGRRAFLDLLLEMAHQGVLPEEEIQPEVDTFMFEGHDTTSAGLVWALYLLGGDQETQAKAQREIDEVWESANADHDGAGLAADDLSRLRYVECCLKEALRIYPSVPLVARELGADAQIAGVTVPAGTLILINQWLVHRDEEHWPDAMRFRPERFLEQQTDRRRHAYAFIPFSAGSRNCIGQRFAIMEEKVVLAWVLRHFHVESVERRDEVQPKMELIMRPMQPIHLRLTPRHRHSGAVATRND